MQANSRLVCVWPSDPGITVSLLRFFETADLSAKLLHLKRRCQKSKNSPIRKNLDFQMEGYKAKPAVRAKMRGRIMLVLGAAKFCRECDGA